MASLKSKATSKNSKSGLSKKAVSKGKVGTGNPPPKEEVETMPYASNVAPPPPPSMLYLRLFSQIPSLRKGTMGVQ